MEVSKIDLEALSDARLREARMLYRGKLFSGAYYLAGYSIELAIKACIAKHIRSGFLPDRNFIIKVYQHKLTELIGLAGLKTELDDAIKTDQRFGGYWGIVADWSEESRYRAWDAAKAAALIKAIDDPTYGVLQWLKKHY